MIEILNWIFIKTGISQKSNFYSADILFRFKFSNRYGNTEICYLANKTHFDQSRPNFC